MKTLRAEGDNSGTPAGHNGCRFDRLRTGIVQLRPEPVEVQGIPFLPWPTPEQRLRRMLDLTGLPVRASYRVAEVAELLDCSDDTVYRMMRDGRLGYLQLGGIWRVDFGSLLALIVE